MRNVAGAKFFGSADPAPLMMPVERAGSSAFDGRRGVELLAGLPLSAFGGGVSAWALVNVPFSMMLNPAHSWSAVTITRVLPSFSAKSRAMATASSKAFISPSVCAASLACDRLSMSAPSTWR